METLSDRFLTVNLVASTCIFYAAARLYVLPNLRSWSFETVMVPILLLHSFRHLGLCFAGCGLRDAGTVRLSAALGDLVAAVPAFASLVAVVPKHRAARAPVAFNVEGTLDLLDAIVWRPCTTHPSTWARRTGFPRSGSRRSW
jgi:hypothetical protein